VSTYYQVSVVRAPEEIDALAEQWDRLWVESHATSPGSQAAMVRHWLDMFGSAGFCAILVSCNDQLVGVLPLTVQQRQVVITEGKLPGNAWSPAGELLIDRSADQMRVMRLILEQLIDLELQWLTLEEISADQEPWQSFLKLLRNKGYRYKLSHEGEGGLINFAGVSWDEFFSARSKNHRKQLRRALRRANEMGRLSFYSYINMTPDLAEELMIRGFEVERKSWKGEQGTAIVQNPRAAKLYIKQARMLAESKQLAIYFLILDEKAIAWEYGWLGGHTYHSLKIGYDRSYAGLSPGQLILMYIIQQGIASKKFSQIDGMGPMGEAFSRWCNDSYDIDRLELPVGGLGHSKFLVRQSIIPAIRTIGAQL
jgi:CelD/BcsL family acetyltransferase involved in cellulose biosynthesis